MLTFARRSSQTHTSKRSPAYHYCALTLANNMHAHTRACTYIVTCTHFQSYTSLPKRRCYTFTVHKFTSVLVVALETCTYYTRKYIPRSQQLLFASSASSWASSHHEHPSPPHHEHKAAAMLRRLSLQPRLRCCASQFSEHWYRKERGPKHTVDRT